MKKATLGVGLQSKEEDWFTSSSVVDGIPPEVIQEVAHWAHRESCRRLTEGGNERARTVTVSVSAHADITRLVDESKDVSTRFHVVECRLVMEHIFSEAMSLVHRTRG